MLFALVVFDGGVVVTVVCGGFGWVLVAGDFGWALVGCFWVVGALRFVAVGWFRFVLFRFLCLGGLVCRCGWFCVLCRLCLLVCWLRVCLVA